MPPGQLSSTERQLSSAWLAANGSTGSDSHVTRDVGIGATALLFVVALLTVTATTTRRRARLTPA